MNYGMRHSLLRCYRVRLRNVYILRANTHTNISAFSWSISALKVCERIEVKGFDADRSRVVWQVYIYWGDRLLIYPHESRDKKAPRYSYRDRRNVGIMKVKFKLSWAAQCTR